MLGYTLEPRTSMIEERVCILEGWTEQELDDYYRQLWRTITGIDDADSDEVEDHWVTIFAIEALRQYERGVVNAIRRI